MANAKNSNNSTGNTYRCWLLFEPSCSVCGDAWFMGAPSLPWWWDVVVSCCCGAPFGKGGRWYGLGLMSNDDTWLNVWLLLLVLPLMLSYRWRSGENNRDMLIFKRRLCFWSLSSSLASSWTQRDPQFICCFRLTRLIKWYDQCSGTCTYIYIVCRLYGVIWLIHTTYKQTSTASFPRRKSSPWNGNVFTVTDDHHTERRNIHFLILESCG